MEESEHKTEKFNFSVPNESPTKGESSFNFEPSENEDDMAPPAIIKVIGVGGGGGNVLTYMADQQLRGVELMVANTDIQDLCAVPESVQKLPLGTSRRRGLGAGMDPVVGEAAAKESISEIEDAIGDANLVFIITTLGGGTGSGATPVISQIAKDKDALTIAIVTHPMVEEQNIRKKNAEYCVKQLHNIVDSLVSIPNDKLSKVIDGAVPFTEAFNHMNQYLADCVTGVANVINSHGLWNLDFKDVESVLTANGAGITLIGKGIATGQNRAESAVQAALHCPLMEDTNLSGVRNVLYNIRANQMSFDEVRNIMKLFHDMMGESGGVYAGIVDDPSMGEELELTLLLTGVDRTRKAGYSDYDADVVQHISEQGVASIDRFTTRNNPASSDFEESPEQDEDQSVVGLRAQVSGGSTRKLASTEIPALFRDQAD